ncbi:MAG: leucine-rich repeat domain-containing protein [bacterium]|nr:leucine-rich repeat domain-containing protein [bacterium]
MESKQEYKSYNIQYQVDENGLQMNYDQTILYGYVGGEITKLEVPDSIVEIAPHAFEGISSLQEVMLHEGLQTLGDYAFHRTSIAKAKLPSTVKDLGICCFTQDDMFLDEFEPCHYIELEVDQDNPYLRSDGQCIYKRMEDGTEELLLCNQSNITSYKMADGTVRIHKQAFLGCSKLTSITFNNQLKAIEEDVFNDCKLERLNIPASVENMSNLPFLTYWTKCGSRYRITLKIDPENRQYFNINGTVYKRGIEGNSLICCSSNETIIPVQDGTTIIGAKAFAECSELEKVILPDTIKVIEKDAFRFCESLTTITTSEQGEEEGLFLPASIEMIEDSAFFGCSIEVLNK